MTTRKKAKGPLRKAKKGRFHLKLSRKQAVRLVAAVVALLLVGTVYVLAARGAVRGYQKRMASGKFSFSGNLTFVGQDFLSPLNSNLNFQGEYSGGAPVQGYAHFNGNLTNHGYVGDTQIANSRLYLALTGPDLPVIRYRQGSFLLPLASGSEYSAKLDESLYDNICAHNQPASLQGKLELYRTMRNLKLSPSPYVDFWSSSGGKPATAVSGSLSGAQLAAFWKALQNAAPPGCGDPNTLGFTSDDLKHMSTHLTLYAGKNQDTIKVTLNDKSLGAHAVFTLTTWDYGQFTAKPVPVRPIDLNAIYAGVPASALLRGGNDN
jgi:hypothetical protein